MRASLPMYDANPSATNAFWSALCEALHHEGLEPPSVLDRSDPADALWTAPDLFVSQTCGYPYASRLRGVVRLIGAPVYAAEGCDGPRYRSALLAREEDDGASLASFAGRRAAFNAVDSQSGYNTLRHAVAPLATDGRFFSQTIESGAHAASARMVRDGQSDICAVDCVTWALLNRDAPEDVAGLTVIGWTAECPSLPFVTSVQTPDGVVDAMRRAFRTLASTAAHAATCDALLFKGLEVLDDEAYETPLQMEREAQSLGYTELK
ncbi:MAG: PhnD/SsuA/transferrin family substrate-binding protein [Pseudomonadota bacterium]